MRDLTLLNFLIVEDNIADFIILTELLTELGVPETQVVGIRDIDELQDQQFDLVLSDLNLSHSRGAETIKALKMKLGEKPIIAMTGILSEDLAIQTIHNGAQEFLVKGEFSKSDLLKSIIFALERSELNGKLVRSQIEFEHIFEHNPLPHLVYDVNDFKIVKANTAFKKLYGYSDSDLLKMDIMDISPESEKIPTKEAIKRYLKSGINLSERFIHITKNNQPLHVEVVLQTYTKENENLAIATIKNVTEQVKVEESLRKSELRFEYATKATSDVIYDWFIETNHIEWSGQIKELFGTEVRPKNIQQLISLIHSEDREEFLQKTNGFLSESTLETEWILKYRLKTKSGEYKYVEDQAVILLDEKNHAYRIIGAIKDITEKVKAEQILQESEGKYNTLFNHSPLPKFICSEDDLKIEQTNFEAKKIIQGSKNDSHFITDVFQLPQSLDLKEEIEKADRSSKVHLGKFPVKNSSLICQLYIHHIFLQNKPMIVFAAADVTELENTQARLEEYIERYKLALKATNDAVWDYDFNKSELLWGENFTAIFGYEVNKVVKLVEWENRIHPNDHESTIGSFNGAITNKKDKWNANYRFLTANGEYAYVFDQCTFIYDQNGNPLRAVGAMQDVSFKREREQQLKLMENAVSSSHDPIIITEAEPIEGTGPKIVYVNQALIDQTGYSRNELIGQTPRIFQGEKTDRKELDRLKKALKAWQPCQIEVVNYKKNGEEFTVQFSVVPIANELGFFTHWISIQRETTQKVRKEEIREVFKRMNIAVAQNKSLEDRYTDVLKQIIEFTGYDFAEGWVTNMDDSKLILAASYHKEHLQNLFKKQGGTFEKANKGEGLPGQVWKEKEILVFENLPGHKDFIRKKEAKALGLETAVAIPILFEDKMIGAICLYSTKARVSFQKHKDFLKSLSLRFGAELKRTKVEQELATIFELTPNLLFVMDQKGGLKKSNALLNSYLDIKEDSLVERNILLHIPIEFHQEFKHYLERLIHSNNSIEIDIPIINEDELKWINITAVYVHNEALIYAVGKDITEQKSLQYLLQKAHEMARIGTWEVNLQKNNIYWSPMTKDIHEVDTNYQPTMDTAIKFYKEGYSRDQVRKNVQMAMDGLIEKWDYDAELVTAKGKTIWVRAQGEVEKIQGKVTRIYGSFQDINQRKLAEQEIGESKMRYDLASKAAKIGIWDWDIINDELIWDDTMLELYDVEKANFEGAYQSWQNGLHPEDRKREHDNIDLALKGKKDFESEFRIIHNRSKEIRYLKAFGYVQRDEDGAPVRMVGMNYDVTKDVIRQRKLIALNKEREDILESITDGFFSVDKEWRVTYWNAAAEKLLDKKKNQMVGQVIWDIFKDAIELKFYEEYHIAIEKNEVRRFIEFYPTLNLWVEVTAFPKENGLAVYFKDITQRIEQEKKFADLKVLQEHVINSTNDLIWAIDSDKNLILGNDSYLEEMQEVSNQIYEIGQPVISATELSWNFDHARKELWLAKYNEALKGNTQQFMLDVGVNLSAKTYQIGLYPILSEESTEIMGVACFARDVTERIKYIEEIEEQNKTLKSIAWTQSHIVRAPVANILGFSNLLKSINSLTETQSRFIKGIEKSAQELDQIIREITNRAHKKA